MSEIEEAGYDWTVREVAVPGAHIPVTLAVGRTRIRNGFLVAMVLGAGGCGLLEPEVCHTGIFFEVTPAEATISVGEGFTPVATVESCPEGVRELSPAWTAEDSSVVDIVGERVTGLSVGKTLVHGRDDQGHVLVTIAVTVVPVP
jgi:hypothetical protein